jgi:hypothetical protein
MRVPGRTLSPLLSTAVREVALIETEDCADGDEFLVTFESRSGDWRHGLWLAVEDGLIEVNGTTAAQISLWVDTAPHSVPIKIHRSDGLLRFYNPWESGGLRRSQSNGSGLMREPVAGGVRFRCSDYGNEPDFGHLVFTLTRRIN